MGNDPTKPFDSKSHNGLYIRTDKPFYFAGEDITGNIYMNIAGGNFPSASLHMKVKGYEKCKWSETRTVWETVPGTNPPQRISKQVTDHYDGENDFYKHKINIHNFQQGFIPSGQYTFPFQFKLKVDLPGTFHQKGHDYEAKIRYKVKAEVDSSNKDLDKLKNSQDIIIREPIKEQVTFLQGQQTLQPTLFCCIPQGTTSFKCCFDKNAYTPGEVATIWVDIDNSMCDLNIQQINTNLTNSLVLFSKQGKQKRISRQVAQSSVPGVRAKETAVDQNRKTMTLQLVDNKTAGKLDPSTNGKIVQSNYTLSANAELDGCCLCCQSDPGVSFQVRIVAAPSIQQMNQIQPPQGWNPQVMNPYQVEFNDNQLYQPAQGGYAMGGGGIALGGQNGQQQQQGYQNPNQQYY